MLILNIAQELCKYLELGLLDDFKTKKGVVQLKNPMGARLQVAVISRIYSNKSFYDENLNNCVDKDSLKLLWQTNWGKPNFGLLDQ